MSVELPPIPPTAEARQPGLEAALAAVKAADPGFDERLFVELVKGEFYRVKQALGERNPASLQAYLSPPLLQAWQAVADRQKEQGVVLATSQLSVYDVRLMWAIHAEGGDLITVGIDGAAAVAGVQEATGQRLFGDGSVQPLTEYWTWSRPAGGQTDPVEPTQCPGCGGPVTPGDGAICRFCGAGLPGRLRGWQLVRVDEQLEWAEGSL